MKKIVLAVCLIVGLLAGLGAYFLRPQPKAEYGWLAFGPDAAVRVLVTLHGEAVTLDHYLDDKPTGRQERFADQLECKDVTIADPDGRTTYTITGMSGTKVRAGIPTEVFVTVAVQGPLRYRQYGDLVLADGLDSAPLAHYHGPLTVAVQRINGQLPEGLALRRGDKPTELRIHIGTMNADKGCWVVVCTEDEQRTHPAFSKDVHPFVDAEFPPRHAGDPPVQPRYSLDHVC